MRSLFVSFVLMALGSGVVSAQDQKRMFIVTSNSGDYRAARCITDGDKCSAAMAAAFCKSRDFARAVSYRKVPRQEITGGVPTEEAACRASKCEEFVAIECER